MEAASAGHCRYCEADQGLGDGVIEALERLFFIVLYGGLAVWLAKDVRRNIRTRSYPSVNRRRWGSLVTCASQPFNFWANMAVKAVGVVSAAIMAAVYLYVFATT
jgi:hypothetical protein